MHDQVDAEFHVQAAAFGAQLQGRDGGGVVQEDHGVSEKTSMAVGEKRPFVLGQFAVAQALGIDAGLLGDQRCTTCSLDISSEKMATCFLWVSPAFFATESRKPVLP